MGAWPFLILIVLGATTLSGCDQLGDEPVQAAPRAAPVAQSQSPQNSRAEELAPNEQAVTWLDEPEGGTAKEIEWDALIPVDWQPETLMADVDIENLSDDDPRAQQLLDKLRARWDKAPVVATLEGEQVKLPGFVVPLEMDAKKIDEFLLVPYYGACIHVP